MQKVDMLHLGHFQGTGRQIFYNVTQWQWMWIKQDEVLVFRIRDNWGFS